MVIEQLEGLKVSETIRKMFSVKDSRTFTLK